MSLPSLKTLRKIVIRSGLTVVAVLLIALVAAWIYAERTRATLPPLPDLSELRPAYGTGVQSQQGMYLGGEYAVEPVPYHDLPPQLVAAVLAAEDEDFFEHRGYNMRSILRAAFDNYRAGETVQGASTITQQVAKHFLAPEKTLQRKFREFLLAREIEDNYSKEEILEAYLGGVYFGAQAWGITQASYTYFSVSPENLTIGQMATLAGLLPAPSVFNPIANPHLAIRERNRVLRRMRDIGMLTDAEKKEAQSHPLEGPYPVDPPISLVPEAVGTVLRAWEEIGGDREWEASDLEITTTHHPGHQVLARQALIDGIEAQDRRRGWRGPAARVIDRDLFDEALDEERRLDGSRLVLARVISADTSGLVLRIPGEKAEIAAEDLEWVRGHHPRTERPRSNRRWHTFFEIDDVVFARRDVDGLNLWQPPIHEGALMVADHHSGEVLASVGSYDISRSRFHRAEQACRQPGSLFKTILYAEAFHRDVTPATLLSDVPTDVASHDGVWQPRNADYDFRGYLTALDAYAASRNIPAANLLQHLGYQPVIERARRMGVHSLLDPTPSLALGANCTRLTEIADVHGAIARQGESMKRENIAYVRDLSTGRIRDRGSFLQYDPAFIPRVTRAARRPQQPIYAVDPPVSHLMLRAMRAAVTRGTAHALSNDWPLAAKTGTSDEFDTWIAVVDPYKTAVVWVGSDQNEDAFARGEHGGTVALPIFADYYDGMAPDIDQWPPDPQPHWDIEEVLIDPATGLLARPGERGIHFPFLPGTSPREFAPTQASRQLEQFDTLMY